MNEKYAVVVTETAFDDLEDISLYIKNQLKEPVIAKRVISKIKEAVFALDTLPHRYELIRNRNLSKEGYRKMIVDNYIVFYMVSEKERKVYISRILYSRRNWQNLL